MESEIKITLKKIHLRSVAITSPSDSLSSGNARNRGRGRPRKSYEDCSIRPKKDGHKSFVARTVACSCCAQ